MFGKLINYEIYLDKYLELLIKTETVLTQRPVDVVGVKGVYQLVYSIECQIPQKSLGTN